MITVTADLGTDKKVAVLGVTYNLEKPQIEDLKIRGAAVLGTARGDDCIYLFMFCYCLSRVSHVTLTITRPIQMSSRPTHEYTVRVWRKDLAEIWL